MRIYMKLGLMGAITAIVLSLSAGGATATRSIRLNGLEAGGRMTWSGRVRFHRVGEEANSITCDITLLRTIRRDIPKARGTLIGKLTGISIDRGATGEHCTAAGGITQPVAITPLVGTNRTGTHRELGAGVLLWDVSGAAVELWKLIYDSFSGTLPAIREVRFHIQKAQILFEYKVLGTQFRCLVEGSINAWINVGARGEGTEGRSESEIRGAERGCEFVNPLDMSGTYVIAPAITGALL